MKKNKILALKYRPQVFSDLIGQEVMVETISNAIKLGKTPNAYLLTGIRGVGKTTTARLIAKSLNCKINEDRKHTMKMILKLIIGEEDNIEKKNRMNFLLNENKTNELLDFYKNGDKMNLKKKTFNRKSEDSKNRGKDKNFKRKEKYKNADKDTQKRLDKIFERKAEKKFKMNHNNKRDKIKTKLKKQGSKSKGKW